MVAFYAAAVSGILLLCIGKCTPLRARAEHEEEGLDHAHHALDVVHLHEEADLNPETPRGLRRIESLDSLNSARRNSVQFGTPVKVDKMRSATGRCGSLLGGHGSAALLGGHGSAALLGSSLGTPESSVHSQWNSHWNSNPSSPAPIPHQTHGHSPNMSTSQSPPIGVPASPPSAMPRLQV